MKSHLFIFISICVTMPSVGIKFSELKPVSSVLNNYYNDSNQDEVLLTYEYFSHGHDLHGFCFSDINDTKLLQFSMSLCQTFGFHSLKKFYPVNNSMLNGLLTGSFTNISCSDDMFHIKHCEWQLTDNVSCSEYLGVDCTYCKESVNISDSEKYVIEIPSSFECSNLSFCEWTITLNKSISNVTVIEINKNNSVPSRLSSDNKTAGYFEITWFDKKKNVWHVKKYSTFNFSGDLFVPSDTLIVRFSVQNSCLSFDGSSVLVRSQNLNEGSSIQYVSHTYYAFSVLVFVACIVLVSFMCICCSIWKRRGGLFGRSYVLSNRSEFDFLYARQMNHSFSKDTDELVVKFSPRKPDPESQFICTSESESVVPETREDGDNTEDKQGYSTSLPGIVKKYSEHSCPSSDKGYLHRMVSLSDEDSRSSVWESVISDQDTRFCVSSNSEGSFCSFQHLDSMSCTCSEPDVFQSLEYIHKH